MKPQNCRHSEKYDEYQITCKPFVIVKADAGTYGMAVMTVRNAEEIRSLNRKNARMSTSKSGQPVHRVIMQEGVYTLKHGVSRMPLQNRSLPLGQRVVGGFYRVHKERGTDENLNAPACISNRWHS